MTELRVALLGVGMMGAFHAEALSTRVRGASVVVVSDYDADRARSVADRVDARVETDPLAAIHADDVDAVLIASPGAAHEEQVLACLDRGIPALCEKPLTTDVESLGPSWQKEAALGRTLVQMGFMRRFDAEYLALKNLIRSGGLGRPLQLHCTHRNPAVPDHFNSEFMIRDSVVHEVDVTRFLLDSEITSVQVLAGAATDAAPEGTHDPMLVVFETGWAAGHRRDLRPLRDRLRGADRGRGRAGERHDRSRPEPGGDVDRRPPGRADHARLRRALRHRLRGRAATLGDAANRGTIDGPGVWDGYAAVAVCEAGVEAVRSGQKVAVGSVPGPTTRRPGVTAPI